MSRWIDIDDISLLKTVSVGGLSAKALWKRIRQQPSIDIVRCKDCKHYEEEYNYCNIHNNISNNIEPTDYCSYGERKDNE